MNETKNEMKTSTKTFGKAAKLEAKEFFPTAKTFKTHGRNKMSQVINFYDVDDNHLGYWTNERKSLGTLRAF